MAADGDDLARKALELPAESRAKLADLLVDSLNGAALNEIDLAWIAEARRRLNDVRSGQSTVPGSEGLKQVRAAIKR